MREFSKGQKIKVKSGGELEIIEKIGEGGQGTVYRVEYNGKEFALKWYFVGKLKDYKRFYINIENNIRKGTPTSSFLWPLEITEYFEGSFGYLMELRPAGYRDFSEFLRAKVHFSGIRAVINAALQITAGFRVLHNNGFSYQDLNDGNFFVNADTGDVLICDNDNVAEYGKAFGIAGKCRYMAPEVVTGKKQPDIHTDRFSLAVILYMLIFVNHPLEGERTLKSPCLTEELERKFYGSEPVFVFDKNNPQNRPVPEIHRNEIRLWSLYPDFVKETFQKAFSRESMIGNDIQHRVTEKTWQEMFIKLRDCIAECTSCRQETFLNLSQPESECVCCGSIITNPYILKVKKNTVALMPSNKIYECHVVYDSEDYKKEMGEVVLSRSIPAVSGLKNNSGRTWTAVAPNGASKNYENGQVIKLVKGLKIRFGNGNDGEIL